MKVKNNLSSKKFGSLTVLSRIKNTGQCKSKPHGRVTYLCLCDCGTVLPTQSVFLLSGNTTSCGCSRRAHITNKVFGRLTVVGFSHIDKNNASNWECVCSCGVRIVVRSNSLISGHTQSCGCLKIETNTRTGEESSRWNKTLTEEDRQKRRSKVEYKEWRQNVFERDKYICRICGEETHNVEAHHLFSYTAYPQERYNFSNGITLCKEHHTQFHQKYGYGDNTPAQFKAWLFSKQEFILPLRS